MGSGVSEPVKEPVTYPIKEPVNRTLHIGTKLFYNGAPMQIVDKVDDPNRGMLYFLVLKDGSGYRRDGFSVFGSQLKDSVTMQNINENEWIQNLSAEIEENKPVGLWFDYGVGNKNVRLKVVGTALTYEGRFPTTYKIVNENNYLSRFEVLYKMEKFKRPNKIRF